jgi:hypothetical protein
MAWKGEVRLQYCGVVVGRSWSVVTWIGKSWQYPYQATFWVILWGLNRRGGLKSLKEDILSATPSHRISLSTDPAYRLYGWGHKALRRIWRPLESLKARLFCQYYISSITHTSWRLLLIGTYKCGLIGLTHGSRRLGDIYPTKLKLAPFPWHTKLDTMSN